MAVQADERQVIARELTGAHVRAMRSGSSTPTASSSAGSEEKAIARHVSLLSKLPPFPVFLVHCLPCLPIYVHLHLSLILQKLSSLVGANILVRELVVEADSVRAH